MIGLSFTRQGLTVNTAPSALSFDPTFGSPATSMFKAGQEATEIGSQANAQSQISNPAETYTLSKEARSDSAASSGTHLSEAADAGKEQIVFTEIARGTVGGNVDAATQRAFKRTLEEDGYTNYESALNPRADDKIWCWALWQRDTVLAAVGISALGSIVLAVLVLRRQHTAMRKIAVREEACNRLIRDTDAACFRALESLNLGIDDLNEKVKNQQRRIDDYDKNTGDMASMEKKGQELKGKLADQEEDIRNFQKDNEELRTSVRAAKAAKDQALVETSRLRTILDGLKRESQHKVTDEDE